MFCCAVRSGPACKSIAVSSWSTERESISLYGVVICVARTCSAVHGIGDGIVNWCPVSGIGLVAGRAFRNGHSRLFCRAVTSSPTCESIAVSSWVIESDGICLNSI